MSLMHLRTFVEVYRQRSLTEAARRLALSQPAVSQQIASLETQIGRKLFDRTRRGVIATGLADELAAALGDSLDHAEAILANLRARSEELSGVVHLAGPAEFVSERLMQRLAPLTAAGLQFRIRVGGRETIYAQLLNGEVDLAVTASVPEEPRLGSAPIATERLVLVTGGAPEAGPADALIRNAPFCAYDFDLPLIRLWCAANSLLPPSRPPSMVIPDLRALVRCVEAGASWSVLPDYLVESGISDGRLRRPYADLVEPENGLYLAWAKGSLRSPRIALARSLLLAE